MVVVLARLDPLKLCPRDAAKGSCSARGLVSGLTIGTLSPLGAPAKRVLVTSRHMLPHPEVGSAGRLLDLVAETAGANTPIGPHGKGLPGMQNPQPSNLDGRWNVRRRQLAD